MLKKDLIKEKRQLLRQRNMLLDQLKKLDSELSTMTFPFDFTGEEPKDDGMWEVVRELVKKKILTEDLNPTEKAIKNDYVRFNDGSQHYKGVNPQPRLVLTSRCLLHIGEFILSQKNKKTI